MPELKALAPARIKWALQLLDVQPDDSVLEIGCGSGIAAQRIVEKLTAGGTYDGVDASDAAVRAAFKRVYDPAHPHRALIRRGEFHADNHEPRLFRRVLAVNCNVFWTDDGEAVRGVHKLTRHGSIFVQVYQPPSAEKRSAIARILKQRLTPLFGSVEARMRTIGDAPLLSIVAKDEPL